MGLMQLLAKRFAAAQRLHKACYRPKVRALSRYVLGPPASIARSFNFGMITCSCGTLTTHLKRTAERRAARANGLRRRHGHDYCAALR